MNLILKREQAVRKGLLGGHRGMDFMLSFRVDLDPQEQALIARYRADDEVIAVISTEGNAIKVVQGEKSGVLTIGDMVDGQLYQCRDVTTLLQVEGVVKDGCKRFKVLLDVMDSFGGEEVVEFGELSEGTTEGAPIAVLPETSIPETSLLDSDE